MNHAEPEHAGAIPYLLEKNIKAKILTTKRGSEAAKIYFKTPEKRIQIVKDGETLSLGSKTLRLRAHSKYQIKN